MVVVFTGSGVLVLSWALALTRHANAIAEKEIFLNIAVDFKVK